jgi:hypothetical protein
MTTRRRCGVAWETTIGDEKREDVHVRSGIDDAAFVGSVASGNADLTGKAGSIAETLRPALARP